MMQTPSMKHHNEVPRPSECMQFGSNPVALSQEFNNTISFGDTTSTPIFFDQLMQNFSDDQSVIIVKKGVTLGCLFMFDRNLFSGLQNSKKKDSWGFLFFLCFPEVFFTGTWFLEGVSGIPVFCRFHRNFLKEFLWDRNSCVYNGFLNIPPDSFGFLFPPNAVLLWPATKVGFLLSEYWLK